jgi:sec-independent protein translocase protein TatC
VDVQGELELKDGTRERIDAPALRRPSERALQWLALAMPFVLYQAWGFIAPGLYHQERRFAFPLLVSSIGLFYAGIAFA